MKPQPSPYTDEDMAHDWNRKRINKFWWPSNVVQSMCHIDDLKAIDPCWKGLVETVNPYGGIQDRLWVRETWAVHKNYDLLPPRMVCNAMNDDFKGCVAYKTSPELSWRGNWRPSIHMPRFACRILLEITEVRVERLHEIDGNGAKAEGALIPPTELYPHTNTNWKLRFEFQKLWESIYNDWESNPWVWVITFKRIKS